MKVDSLQTMGLTQTPYNASNLAPSTQRSVQDAASVSDSSVVVNDASLALNAEKTLSVDKSRGLLDQANALLKLSNTDIEFKLDDTSGKAIFYIKDASTGEVLLQIPKEAMLKLSQNIDKFLEAASQLSGSQMQDAILSGLLTDKKV